MKKIILFLPLGLVILQSFLLTNISHAQRQRSNWIQQKNAYKGRWRVGFGIDVTDPTGVDMQFYRLNGVCDRSFSITKKIAIGIWAGMEGIVTGPIIEKQNNDANWESGSIRFGSDIKFYLPMALNPYIGIGFESGKRKYFGLNEMSTDIVARLGIEHKIVGTKLSTQSGLNITLFIDGKLNKSIDKDFMYITPSVGLRFHWL
ncbi:hypothetical protein [Tenuifilum thalassicum]|uniref:Outer membrane protein beta-barrel domain-containing protein n=1 Tax=Tenuifilum thalassicum TaxID=2590900 RepID=A0A7D4BC98_9BACT|nr:hypothetical protein [Tenuifilum thalassicum]QKG80700.1 hypothetical protein FHG85_10630 [Tenuifilum thalassicum]